MDFSLNLWGINQTQQLIQMKTAFLRLLLCINIIAIVLLASCNEKRIYKIGISQCSQDDWRTKMNEEINREVISRDNVMVEIRSADDDNAKQIADIEYFVENGFDIIIVAPNEAAALTPTIKKVYESGMPVITFDRNIIGNSYTARVGVDNVDMGRSAAHYALHLVGDKAKAIEIYGLRGSTPADDRHRGFVDEFTGNGGNIVATGDGNWNKEDAIVVADSLLRLHPDVNVIYAHNDRMAIGASEVATSMGLRDKIKIFGIDAAPTIGISAVADGIIDATFVYPTEGYRLIQLAIDILENKPFDRELVLPLASAVDKTNADILLLQNETLKEEAGKIRVLKSKIDLYWSQYNAQTTLFYASVVIILLLSGVGFLLLRAFWQHKKHKEVLLQQNHLLEEQRDRQKELNEKLEQATQSKLVFFTNVSHDLRTPLTLIAEPVAQLASATNLTAQQRVLMKIADKNVHILQRLINQILDFRKYENGKLELNLSEIDFGKSLQGWLESFIAIARRRDISLTLLPPDNDNQVIIAVDAEKMERIIFNLLSNAFKYTPDNGSITVSYEVTNENLMLRITDSGCGIAKEDMSKIFDRFYQADKVHPQGSGIGLALVKAFVELHGGTITADSKQGKGSTFTINLPLRKLEVPQSEPEKHIDGTTVATELGTIDSEVKFDDDKPLLLVIDDNSDIQNLIAVLLGNEYNVITASNGSEGLRKASKYVPDIIICDVMMPVMDGMECCRRIKAEVSTSHIPVIMLTACSLDEQRVQCYESGSDGYISKPFNHDVLRSRCKSLMANRKRIKELWQGSAIATTVKSQPTEKQKLPQQSGDIDNDFYRRFIELFTTEMGNPELNVDAIAQRMGLERSQFYRKIKALTNYSPVELIRNLRLKQARKLLTSTEKTVSEIAYESGFSTPAYFTKCYRDAYGETPSETRSHLSR